MAAMPGPRRVVAVLNASAGDDGKRSVADRLAELLRGHGIEARVLLADSGEQLVELAKGAVRDKPDMILAGGGDGTINAVATQVVGTGIALGVLPLGTLNHFAKALRMPEDLDAAVAVVVAGRTAQVDVGDVNGRIFLNNSSLGLYPSLVRKRDAQQEQLGRGKWAAALWAALTLLRRHALLRVHVTVNGAKIQRRTPTLFVGNNAYTMNGLHVGERERLDGGQLGLYLLHRNGRTGLLWLALRAMVGALREAKDFDTVLAEAICIETHRKRLLVAIDGEVVPMASPLNYRIRPGALRVVVPAPAVDPA